MDKEDEAKRRALRSRQSLLEMEGALLMQDWVAPAGEVKAVSSW